MKTIDRPLPVKPLRVLDRGALARVRGGGDLDDEAARELRAREVSPGRIADDGNQ